MMKSSENEYRECERTPQQQQPRRNVWTSGVWCDVRIAYPHTTKNEKNMKTIALHPNMESWFPRSCSTRNSIMLLWMSSERIMMIVWCSCFHDFIETKKMSADKMSCYCIIIKANNDGQLVIASFVFIQQNWTICMRQFKFKTKRIQSKRLTEFVCEWVYHSAFWTEPKSFVMPHATKINKIQTTNEWHMQKREPKKNQQKSKRKTWIAFVATAVASTKEY